MQKQSEHTSGSAEWRKRLVNDLTKNKTPTSMFYASVDIRKLLNKFNGKVWNSGLNRYINTKRFVIRYSNNGVHMHPVKERE